MPQKIWFGAATLVDSRPAVHNIFTFSYLCLADSQEEAIGKLVMTAMQQNPGYTVGHTGMRELTPDELRMAGYVPAAEV